MNKTITSEINVHLFEYTKPRLCGRAARACYDNGDKTEQDDIELTNKLLIAQHMEPLENSHLYFECLIPKYVASQLNRHRVGIGRCQQSLRLSLAKPLFFWPDDVPLFEDDMTIIAQAIALIDDLKNANRREREIRQRLIPDNLMVQYRTWMNFREFLQLIDKRLTVHAQKECKAVVQRMVDCVMMTEWSEILNEHMTRVPF